MRHATPEEQQRYKDAKKLGRQKQKEILRAWQALQIKQDTAISRASKESELKETEWEHGNIFSFLVARRWTIPFARPL